MTIRVRQTKNGQHIVANNYDGRRLAGPFGTKAEAVAAIASDQIPPAPANARELKREQAQRGRATQMRNAVSEGESSEDVEREIVRGAQRGRPRKNS